jgi:hypothetical protein
MRNARNLVAWAVWSVTVLAGCATMPSPGGQPAKSQELPLLPSNASEKTAGSAPSKQSSFWKIEIGMTKEAVIAILGRQPDGTSEERPGGSLSVGRPTWCFWDDREARISVLFEDDSSGRQVVRDVKRS